MTIIFLNQLIQNLVELTLKFLDQILGKRAEWSPDILFANIYKTIQKVSYLTLLNVYNIC